MGVPSFLVDAELNGTGGSACLMLPWAGDRRKQKPYSIVPWVGNPVPLHHGTGSSACEQERQTKNKHHLPATF